jgi:riboflavin synthase
MFTGIIEEVGTVEVMETRAAGARLRLQCHAVLDGTGEGASISVNGVCLTVVDLRETSFAADATPETMRRSNLGDLRRGSQVNLERSLSPGGRLGGHIVQGHVDGTGDLVSLEALGDGNWWLKVRVPSELERYFVEKGSVAIDGISLTIASVDAGVVSVSIIPHTYQNTNLRSRRSGDRLNLECDILAKYVEKLLSARETKGLTIERLKDLGY